MLTVRSGLASRNCSGHTRRAALKAGFLGLAGLGLPDYLRAKAATRGLTAPGSPVGPADRSGILIWLDGGPSQVETFDPKPDAPAGYRGPFGVARTRTPGVNFSARMPRCAARFDRLSVVRSLHHDDGDRFAAAHGMTIGVSDR